jgi:hypothetical protein
VGRSSGDTATVAVTALRYCLYTVLAAFAVSTGQLRTQFTHSSQSHMHASAINQSIKQGASSSSSGSTLTVPKQQQQQQRGSTSAQGGLTGAGYKGLGLTRQALAALGYRRSSVAVPAHQEESPMLQVSV